MPAHATMQLTDNYLYVKASGNIASVDEGLAYIQPQMDLAQKKGIRLLLVDERDMTITLDSTDILATAEYLSTQGVPALGLRIATLPPPSAPQPQQAYETFSNNRSMVYKAFFNEQEALN